MRFRLSAIDFVVRGLSEQKAHDDAAIVSLDGMPKEAVTQAAHDAMIGARLRTLAVAGVISFDTGGVCRVDRARLIKIQRRRALRLYTLFGLGVLVVLAPILLALFYSARG